MHAILTASWKGLVLFAMVFVSRGGCWPRAAFLPDAGLFVRGLVCWAGVGRSCGAKVCSQTALFLGLVSVRAWNGRVSGF